MPQSAVRDLRQDGISTYAVQLLCFNASIGSS
jgi:hypothetical protein